MSVVSNTGVAKGYDALCRTLVQDPLSGGLRRGLCRQVCGFGIRFPFGGLLTFRTCLWVTDGHGIY